MDWIIEELIKLSLGDKRLNYRAQKILKHTVSDWDMSNLILNKSINYILKYTCKIFTTFNFKTLSRDFNCIRFTRMFFKI